MCDGGWVDELCLGIALGLSWAEGELGCCAGEEERLSIVFILVNAFAVGWLLGS